MLKGLSNIMKKNKKELHLSSIVGYENLKMYQPADAFRMTSDALALANFVNFNFSDKEVLDIGTGLAGIPLVLSSRSGAHITGVEIEKYVADIAIQSVLYNQLTDRITIVNQDIKEYARDCSPNIYDIIVSNPPYYSLDDGYLNDSTIIQGARHDVRLQLEDIFIVATKLLKNNGKLLLVFTTDRMIEVINLYQKYHFSIKRIQFIHGTIQKSAKTFLIEGAKNGKKGTKVSSPLILQ